MGAFFLVIDWNWFIFVKLKFYEHGQCFVSYCHKH